MLKLLIVDDNHVFCQNVKDIFELKNWEVTTAYDGTDALSRVRETHFDLVLMDFKMPGMNGVETFGHMQTIQPDIKVVMVTAHTVVSFIDEALRTGLWGVVSKPLDFKKLFTIVDGVVKKGDTILVVDDDTVFCVNMMDLFREKGFHVHMATHGEAAVQLTREIKFDLILLDLNLPGINGLEAFLEIQAVRPDVVVIAVTGYAGTLKTLIDKALENNVYACLEKPLDMALLDSLIKDIHTDRTDGVAE